MNRTAIASVHGRRVWDSRGRPTVEAELRLACGAVGRAIAPAGASTGSGEAIDRRDGGARFGGFDVRQALASIKGEIATTLLGADAADQNNIDRRLVDLDGTPNKSRLGANATIAVSMAAAHAAAMALDLPLWRYFGGSRASHLPLPEIQIFGGGAHAGRRVDVQDFMVIATGAASFAEALDWTAEIYRVAGRILVDDGRLAGVADEGGFWPAFDSNEQAIETLLRAIELAGFRPLEQVAIALDIAASELGQAGRYRMGLEKREFDGDGLSELLLGWLRRFPIVSIEDPLADDDARGFARFTAAAGARVQVVGDDFIVTDAARIARAAAAGACNTALIKPNQAGTLSETDAAFRAAGRAGWGAIVSARSGESEDTTIVHLAVGWGAKQLKVGAFARSERTAKWNEGLRIAEALGGDGPLPPRSAFPWDGG